MEQCRPETALTIPMQVDLPDISERFLGGNFFFRQIESRQKVGHFLGIQHHGARFAYRGPIVIAPVGPERLDCGSDIGIRECPHLESVVRESRQESSRSNAERMPTSDGPKNRNQSGRAQLIPLQQALTIDLVEPPFGVAPPGRVAESERFEGAQKTRFPEVHGQSRMSVRASRSAAQRHSPLARMPRLDSFSTKAASEESYAMNLSKAPRGCQKKAIRCPLRVVSSSSTPEPLANHQSRCP
jgi:hypothetical protein